MQPNDARTVRGAALSTAVAAAIVLPLGGVLAGFEGLLSSGLGVLISTVFFGTTLIVLTWVGHNRPELFFGAALGVFLGLAIMLLLTMVLLRDAAFLDGPAFAAGVLGGLLGWLTGQIWGTLTAKTYYVEVEGESAATPAGGASEDAR